MSKRSKDLIVETALLVSSYVAHNKVAPTTLPSLLETLYEALAILERAPAVRQAVVKPTPAEIKASICHTALISFEDGQPYKTLRRHLTMRGISPEAYRTKWGLPADYPLVSAAYSARRSEISRGIAAGARMRSQALLHAAE